jgi:sterol desaturase/sphingolipid hydroxylase (fatty acid hydroxylase superfamily)
VFLAEVASVGWAESSLRAILRAPTASMKTDMVSVFAWLTPIMTLFSAVATFGVVLVAGGWLHGLLQRLTGLSFSVAAAPLAVQVGATFLVFSFFDYWSHRLDHSSAFWPLHRFHHAAEEFCVLTSSRTHPAVFTAIVGSTLPGAAICASPAALVDMNLVVLALRFLIHSRIASDFGWVGRYLVQSPAHHRLHHRLIGRAEATNFSLAPIWDHLFGTWAELPPEPARIGVQAPYRHGALPLADAWRDYAEFWRGLLGWLSPKAMRRA